jgi:phasin family protein
MQDELLDRWRQLAQNTLDSLRELGEINTRLMERLSRQQLEIVNATFEATARETQLVTQSRDPRDFLEKQASFAAEYNRRFLDIARRSTDILGQAREEMTAWMERGLQVADRSMERTVEAADEGTARAGRSAGRAAKGAARSKGGAGKRAG